MVPGGTVTGTLTRAPALVIVTTPFCSLALTLPPASAVAQDPCSARVWASVTSVIWSSGVAAEYRLLYWLSMSSTSVSRV